MYPLWTGARLEKLLYKRAEYGRLCDWSVVLPNNFIILSWSVEWSGASINIYTVGELTDSAFIYHERLYFVGLYIFY